jgi:hypothetical protein
VRQLRSITRLAPSSRSTGRTLTGPVPCTTFFKLPTCTATSTSEQRFHERMNRFPTVALTWKIARYAARQERHASPLSGIFHNPA